MNIIEALKTGLDIARPGRTFSGCEFMSNVYPASQFLTREDLIADDWIVRESKISITRQEFFKAVADTMNEAGVELHGPSGYRRPYPSDVSCFQDWRKLADKLGFK